MNCTLTVHQSRNSADTFPQCTGCLLWIFNMWRCLLLLPWGHQWLRCLTVRGHFLSSSAYINKPRDGGHMNMSNMWDYMTAKMYDVNWIKINENCAFLIKCRCYIPMTLFTLSLYSMAACRNVALYSKCARVPLSASMLYNPGGGQRCIYIYMKKVTALLLP